MADPLDVLDLLRHVAASRPAPSSLAIERELITQGASGVSVAPSCASLTLFDPASGEFETAAATDPTARKLDEVQYSLGEGPCLDVVKGDYFIVAGDLRDDERWVRFGPKAADLGMRSLLAVCLTGEPVVVALNLYSTDRDAFVEPLDDLWLVASFARVLLGYAQPSGLTDALLGTCVTGAATVLVTRHFGIDRCAAFEVMLRAARDHDMALIELARAIVAAPPPV